MCFVEADTLSVCILAEEEAAEEKMHAWGHHTHKHMLRIAMETSISLQRAGFFFFFFCFLFSTEAFGKLEISNEEFHSKRTD